MSQHSYKTPTGKDWRVGLLIIFGYVLGIGLTAFWLLPDYWYLWILVVLGGMIWIVNWHTHNYAYQCLHCGQIFEISFLKNLISPHGVDSQGGWTLLKCPHCGRLSQARIVKIVVEESNSDPSNYPK